ncbi:hypothetical protein DXA13_15875 [Clostridium sp. AM58-1XD]|nr:hypothetical protein DXA13_15875 [Clostridium sp. AM58-1XD]
MSTKGTLYLRIPVSAYTAEIRALKSARGVVSAKRIRYNVHKGDIISAHTGFCVYRRNPCA